MYYIKGNKERGDEVITLLEKKGGVNHNCLKGNREECWYYIDKLNNICFSNYNDILSKVYTELTLPELKWAPKFKLKDSICYAINKPNEYVVGKGTIVAIDKKNKSYLISDSGIVFIPEKYIYLWQPTRNETVLVRDTNNQRWQEAIFSHMEDGFYFMVGGRGWCCCIPFNINKLGEN